MPCAIGNQSSGCLNSEAEAAFKLYHHRSMKTWSLGRVTLHAVRAATSSVFLGAEIAARYQKRGARGRRWLGLQPLFNSSGLFCGGKDSSVQTGALSLSA